MLKINFEAINSFWNLTDHLKNGEPLTEERWFDFYKLDGNKMYAEANVGQDGIEAYKKALEIVFCPHKEKELHKRIQEQDEWVTKIYRYKLHEEDFKCFQRTLSDPGYIDQMYGHAYSQLPSSMHGVEENGTIFFTAFGADAAALDKKIFLSLHLSFFFDKYKKGAIAGHELHHLLRKEYEFNKPVLDMHKGITYLLEGMLSEGVADLIDKAIVIEHNDDLPPELQWKSILVSSATHVIKNIDACIAGANNWTGSTYKSEKDFRRIVMNTSGHVPGFFMASVINKNGYHRELMENVSDPFHFIKLYNKAAKEDESKPVLFSSKSIKNIESIEAYYKN